MAPADDVDTGSVRSGGSGTSGGMSETSSQRSDTKFLKKRHMLGQSANREETDLLEQKRNLQEGVFACMYTLVRQSALARWKWAVLKVFLEFMMNFIVAFNPSATVLRIDTSSPVWQFVRWIVWRSPIMRLYGYRTYVLIMYGMVFAVVLSVLGLAWLTLAMRKQEQSKLLRAAGTFLHVIFDIMFVMCYVSFFDYFVFMADCAFGSSGEHLYFKGVVCTQMPHLLHMLVGLATAALFLCVTALMVVASCDLNPVSSGYLASPAAYARLRILLAKAVYIVFANCLDSNPKLQVLGMLVAVACIFYWNFRTLPFYRRTTNIVWNGLWGGILVPIVIVSILTFGKDKSEQRKHDMTRMVLYAVFPVTLATMGLSALYGWWAMRPARKFRDLPPGTKLTRVHKFESVEEVERLARVMRVFDMDGLADPDAAALGEVIIKAGMQAFPNSPYLLILYANFKLEVRRDGPGARTQLQLAGKAAPNLVQKYQIFCTNEASKRLKDSVEGGMDLQAYIEFKRNFRAVLRVHKEVLLTQAELWNLCMRPTVKVTQVDAAMDALETASGRAHQVYKRVLERYPTNAKLLRCYGKFLEDVRHDQSAAARAYTEANRHGGGAGGTALLALDLGAGMGGHVSGEEGAVARPDFLTSMSLEDDAVIVADAEGTIMMVSQAVQKTFGWAKAELEGSNLSMLMPQPFSQRHPGYMSRYTGGGEPHILDSVREVVALHKERYVFPVALCVTKLSGAGADSVFLGLIRPLPPNIHVMRAWCAPNGVFLCADQQFASAVGMAEGEMVGHTLSSLAADPEAAEALLNDGRSATEGALTNGLVRGTLRLKHRYREPVQLDLVLRPAGTDAQRILVLHAARTDGLSAAGLMAVDAHMRIRFASAELALLTGYPARRMAGMRLDALLPPPYNALHAKWIRDPPHEVPLGSCRAGAAVSLLAESGAQVPVRLVVRAMEPEAAAAAGASTMYTVEVTKLSAEEALSEKRLVLRTDFSGNVLSVSPPDSRLFDFPASQLVGRCVADSVDIFADWAAKSGDGQMQLLLLALLYKEQEMPGTSWRVRVRPPSATGSDLPALPGQTAKPAGGRAAASRSACLQVELEEGGEDEGDDSAMTRVTVTLWRRDLLSGVVELDEQLVVRKASPLTGLITGLPASAMLRKPLDRFLDLPPGATWDRLVSAATAGRHAHAKSALKGAPERAAVSPVMAFLGPHPDSGTMRLMLQGVRTLGPGGRPKITVTLHPDTLYVGAHADLMRVLKLDGGADSHAGGDSSHGDGDRPDSGRSRAVSVAPSAARSRWGSRSRSRSRSRPKEAHADHGVQLSAHSSAEQPAPAAAGDLQAAVDTVRVGAADAPDGGNRDGATEEPEPGAQGADAGEIHGSGQGEGRRSRGGSEHSDDEGAGPSLHRQATSKSEFVAQWVRTLSKQVSGELAGGAKRGLGGGGGRSRTGPRASCKLLVIQEGDMAGLEGKPSAIFLSDPDPLPVPENPPAENLSEPLPGAKQRLAPVGARGERGDGESPPKPKGRATVVASGGDPDGDGGPDAFKGDKDDKGSESGDSSADGSQTAGSVFSDATATTLVSEAALDGRRARLLRALNKLLLGPSLLGRIQTLHTHSYALVALMFIAHLVPYIVITSLIRLEHDNIYNVHRQAMAMDRSQLIAVRTMAGAFCSRANVTDKVGVCGNSLNFTLDKLTTNVLLMEQYHQSVYLGRSASRVSKQPKNVYDIWTQPNLDYHVYLDTSPPQVVVEQAGAWLLGNRYIAAAREAQFLLPKLLDTYKLHRSFHFILTNGLGPLFEGYATSLDMLVEAAWDSVAKLRTELIALLIVEALLIQTVCSLYEAVLVARLEQARLTGMLAMLGLPGPVLRQMATAEHKIVDDSDDESDDADSCGGEEERKPVAGGAGGAAQPPASARATAIAPGGSEPAAAPRRVTTPNEGGLGGGGTALSKELSLAGAGDDAKAAQRSGSPAGNLKSDNTAAAEPTANGTVQSARLNGSRRAAAAEAAAARKRSTYRINGKSLLPSYWNVSKFMAPFFLWNVAVLLVYAISLIKLQGMQEPLSSLSMASRVTYRYTRVRAVALAFVTADEPASKAEWRAMLTQELDTFESEYGALMYGGEPSSMTRSSFRQKVPAGTFFSSAFASAFFRSKGCFRYDQAACFPPGHEYYEVTHNGLDVMVRRVLAEMRLLTLDADSDAVYNSSRYIFMSIVGANDLYEGLQQAAQMFVDYSISRYDQVAELHTILLAVSVVVVPGFLLFLLWPHSRRMLRDAARQSGLLSLVPPELDVKGHVRAVFRRAAGKTSARKDGAGGSVAAAPLAL